MFDAHWLREIFSQAGKEIHIRMGLEVLFEELGNNLNAHQQTNESAGLYSSNGILYSGLNEWIRATCINTGKYFQDLKWKKHTAERNVQHIKQCDILFMDTYPWIHTYYMCICSNMYYVQKHSRERQMPSSGTEVTSR